MTAAEPVALWYDFRATFRRPNGRTVHLRTIERTPWQAVDKMRAAWPLAVTDRLLHISRSRAARYIGPPLRPIAAPVEADA